MYLVGDNGASAEGGMSGMFNEMTYFNGVAGVGVRHAEEHRRLGRPETFPHMAAGWAVAGNTPFMWTKQVASDFGGTRNPLVVQLAERHQGQGRDSAASSSHVVDIAPTVLEAAKHSGAEDR